MHIPKKIYLIRHGQTDYNKNGIVQGSKINASLNAAGLEQAKAFYEAYKIIPFDMIYTSNLKRTKESVQQFIDSGIALKSFAGLNEISWGDYDGKKIQEGDYYWQVVEEWKKGNVRLSAKNGESPQIVADRQIEVIEAIKSEEASNLLVCMHGRAMRILLCQLMDEPLVSMDQYQHHNLGLYVIDFNGSTFTLKEKNVVTHLSNII